MRITASRYVTQCCMPLCLLLLVLVAQASPIPIGPSKVDPSLDWRTLETEHFSIHFYQGEEQLALRIATITERVRKRLTQAMQCRPSGRTHIVINDSVDVVNAVATPMLYNQIYVYPTQPVLGLGHFEDWLESLLLHEYTHILDMGQVEGLTEIVQSVFGKLWFPKALNSRLFLEGYAVYNETHYSNGGRGRDPYTEMFLRESFLADDVPSLRRLLFWGIYPGGHQPYTYGGAFFRYMDEKYGAASSHTFQRYLASDLWPWNADGAARLSTARPLRLLWEEWKQELLQRYRQQEAAVRRQGVTKSQSVVNSKSSKWSPIWSPTGDNIYYFSAKTDAQPEIRQIELRSGRDTSVTDLHTLTKHVGLSLSPDGTQLLFPQIGFHRSFSVSHDLWIRDLQRNKTWRLTEAERVTDPAWSPNGQVILAVKNDQGKTQLVSIEPKMKRIRMLQPQSPELRFSEPAWAPDSNAFAVSAWQKGGYQDIWVFDTEGQTGYPLLHDKAWDVSPCWTPDGKYVLFASDRTGVYNLFAYQLETKRLYQVTNVLSGAFDPSVSPDGTQIAFVIYSKDGFNIHTMAFDPAEWRLVHQDSYTDPSGALFFTGYQKVTQNVDATQNMQANQPVPYRIHPYRSFSTLLPRFWIPYPTADESGLAVGALTAGRDVLGKHSYAAVAQYGVSSRRPGYFLQYVNDQFYPSIGLTFWDMPEIVHFRSRPENRLFTWHRSRGVSAQINLPHTTVGYQQEFRLGIETERSAFQDWPQDVEFPLATRLVDLFIGWNFSNTHRYPRGISQTNGVKCSLFYRKYLARLGSTVNLSEILVDAQLYLGIPFDRHVLAWKGSLVYNNRDLPMFQSQLNALAIRSFESLYVGNQFFSTLEYRFPIIEIRRGWQILPLFLEQLHGAMFADLTGTLSSSNQQLAIGSEMRLDASAGYILRSTLKLSLALKLKPKRKLRAFVQIGETF